MPDSWDISLSAVVSSLRNLLSLDSLRANGVSLTVGFGLYRLVLPRDVSIDLEAGASAVDLAEGAIRTGEPDSLLGPATVAANIARRPFLSGIDCDWVDSRRQRLRRQLLRALDCLTTKWLLKSEAGLAVETASEAISIDPYREKSYQLLMQAHTADGNSAEALRTYHRLRELLAADLGTDPTKETATLYKQILG